MRIISIRANKMKTAGTWALPDTPDKASQLAAIVRTLRGGELPAKDVSEHIYRLLGDDDLFDELGRLEKAYAQGCASAIAKRVRGLAAQPPGDFKDPQAHANLVELARTLGEPAGASRTARDSKPTMDGRQREGKTTARRCPSCGAKNPHDDDACLQCGEPLADMASQLDRPFEERIREFEEEMFPIPDAIRDDRRWVWKAERTQRDTDIDELREKYFRVAKKEAPNQA